MRDDMFRIFSGHYDNVQREQFERDLSEKSEVLILEDSAGRLQGFSTLVAWNEEFEGERLRVLFSGDTLIDSAHWGTQALAFTWLRHAGQLQAEASGRRLFWFLIVKGHRTYRYLPTFAVKFHPDWRVTEDPFLKRLADHLATHRFGNNYDLARGVIRFSQSRGQLTATLAEPSVREAERPDVQFFLARNPGYRHGDELVCVCELSEENLQPIARRLFLQGQEG